jgi:hypothetical protein
MATPTKYASFLVRLWREGDPQLSAPTAGWQGEIEHIQSGQRWTFNTLDELLDFLHRQAEEPEMLERQVG